MEEIKTLVVNDKWIANHFGITLEGFQNLLFNADEIGISFPDCEEELEENVWNIIKVLGWYKINQDLVDELSTEDVLELYSVEDILKWLQGKKPTVQ